jgi:hypothetical protein
MSPTRLADLAFRSDGENRKQREMLRRDHAAALFRKMLTRQGRCAVAWDRDVAPIVGDLLLEAPRMWPKGWTSEKSRLTVYVGIWGEEDDRNACFIWRSDPNDPLRGRWVREDFE